MELCRQKEVHRSIVLDFPYTLLHKAQTLALVGQQLRAILLRTQPMLAQFQITY